MRLAFGPFVFDRHARELLQDGRRVHLSPKAFDMLGILLEARPNVVGKNDLQDRIWGPGTVVTDANLTVLVAEIRHVLGDDSRDAKFVRTVHRVGYAFSAPAEDLAAARGDQPGFSGCWLVWNDKTFPLPAGETVVGRDPRCGIWVEASGVSRRHAAIRVSPSGATVEDLGSRNGTFVAGTPVTDPRTLRDGDAIEIGEATILFRAWPGARPPRTERIVRRVNRRG